VVAVGRVVVVDVVHFVHIVVGFVPAVLEFPGRVLCLVPLVLEFPERVVPVIAADSISVPAFVFVACGWSCGWSCNAYKLLV